MEAVRKDLEKCQFGNWKELSKDRRKKWKETIEVFGL
jgi:hypothetical protein